MIVRRPSTGHRSRDQLHTVSTIHQMRFNWFCRTIDDPTFNQISKCTWQKGISIEIKMHCIQSAVSLIWVRCTSCTFLKLIKRSRLLLEIIAAPNRMRMRDTFNGNKCVHSSGILCKWPKTMRSTTQFWCDRKSGNRTPKPQSSSSEIFSHVKSFVFRSVCVFF